MSNTELTCRICKKPGWRMAVSLPTNGNALRMNCYAREIMENRKEYEEAPSKETEIGVWIIICLIELRESRLLRLASGAEDGGSSAGDFLMEHCSSVSTKRECSNSRTLNAD